MRYRKEKEKEERVEKKRSEEEREGGLSLSLSPFPLKFSISSHPGCQDATINGTLVALQLQLHSVTVHITFHQGSSSLFLLVPEIEIKANGEKFCVVTHET